MRISINGDNIDIVEAVNFPDLVKNTADNCYFIGKSDDPFYICNLGDIAQKHALWTKKFPRVSPFYAIKCNPSSLVVKLLASLGVGFDCASRGEISQILSYGVHPSRIIYANPCKQLSHIRYSESVGVSLMTFDSYPELLKISKVHPEAKLILRLATDVSKARCPLGLKFGTPIGKVEDLLKSAYALGLDVCGVSFHVGSGCFDPTAYSEAIMLAYEAFCIAESLGHNMTILDIGGGFPGNIESSENAELLDDVSNVVNHMIDKYFPADSGVSIIAEPGRFYVSSAFHLSCTVTSVRETLNPNVESSRNTIYNYFLNDGVYGSFNCIIFDHYIGSYYIIDNDCAHSDSGSEVYDTIFWGPTCDSMDKVLGDIKCQKLDIGSRVVFRDMGAYTMAAGSNFNGFESPFVRWVIDSSQWIAISGLLEDRIVFGKNELGDLVLVAAGTSEQ